MTINFDHLEDSRRELVVSVVRSALFVVTRHLGEDEVSSIQRQSDWKKLFKELDDRSITHLENADAKACLEALHLAMYKLGPFELHTITGKTLREYASAGLILADEVYGGVYLGTLWTEEDYL
jgi:hypothetical protein